MKYIIAALLILLVSCDKTSEELAHMSLADQKAYWEDQLLDFNDHIIVTDRMRIHNLIVQSTINGIDYQLDFEKSKLERAKRDSANLAYAAKLEADTKQMLLNEMEQARKAKEYYARALDSLKDTISAIKAMQVHQ